MSSAGRMVDAVMLGAPQGEDALPVLIITLTAVG